LYLRAVLPLPFRRRQGGHRAGAVHHQGHLPAARVPLWRPEHPRQGLGVLVHHESSAHRRINPNPNMEAFMLTITVAQDGSGHFATIGEAVQAVPYDTPARILIGPGTYREKLSCEKQDITLQGAGMTETRLVWNDGGKLPHPDGRPTHTFRSWTAFFSGERLTVEDMTIENDAGPGARVGQGIAAYVDSRRAVFRRVRLLGSQDTLFCAPLPEKEREKDGFLGPRMFVPRRASAQYYQGCQITGDIDFIFGGADALFEQCVLRSADNPPAHGEARGYVAAPCTPPEGLGFVFWDCDFVS